MSFVFFIISIVIYVGLVFKLLQYLPGGRAGISIVVRFCSFFFFQQFKQVTVVNNVCLWAFLFRPVVNVLFRHKQALHAFKEGMTLFVDL